MLKVDIKEQGKIKIVIPEGYLDNSTLSILEKAVDPFFKDKEPPRILMDFSKLTYLNSTGLSKLLQYHMHVKRQNEGYFKLFGLSQFIREILDICGAVKILQIYRTEADARESIGSLN